MTVTKKSVKLRFPEGWLEVHPLTHADLQSEGEHLAAIGYDMEVE